MASPAPTARLMAFATPAVQHGGRRPSPGTRIPAHHQGERCLAYRAPVGNGVPGRVMQPCWVVRFSPITVGESWLTKVTLVCLAPLVTLARTRSISRGQWFSGLLLWAALGATISSWWFVRNLHLYGDLLGRQELINPDQYRWNMVPKTLSSPFFQGSFWRLTA